MRREGRVRGGRGGCEEGGEGTRREERVRGGRRGYEEGGVRK